MRFIGLDLLANAPDAAGRPGDPVFSANGMNRVTRYAELIRHYRDRWTAEGRDPAEALGARDTGRPT